ncbi:TnsA endonuclease N-terminal domain-containing protein [Paenibacillus sp. 7523-1]|uniref:TnsA endonuclease N-terminal domain-containing protein n=1 Tax=Paenibacillus sp. 7523-1 TaxID=2022550 RepID=UPI000BA796D8|nr:TnsA endonuclease N-terminal domain-containing protein [Paenibacillus sp. 7523-1]PAD28716.1 hypothetical protein CHH60_23740 [Paenibacillus sp. 7523-1]
MFDQPVRKIKPKTKGFRGKEPFLTTGVMIPWDSFLERDFIRLADFDLCVEDIYAQNVKITYLYNGKLHEHYPDFKVVTDDNLVWIVEVKPTAFVHKEENQIKFLAGRAYCEERGWTYLVMTEEDIRPGYLQDNLDLLRGLGIEEVETSILDIVLTHLAKIEECSIKELQKMCSELSEEEYYRSIYQLIYFQEVHCDMILYSITGNSRIWSKE